MFPGNYFDREWLDYVPLFDRNNSVSSHINLKVNLSLDFFQNLRLDKESCKLYRIEAAKKCATTLGENLALCISGGVDSQAMLHSFIESGVKFTAYTFVFNNDLNIFDVNLARKYCYEHRVELIEIPFNILYFLTNENYDYSIKYQSASPHFNTHYKFCDMLKEKGHTGVCFGGNTPFNSRVNWGNHFERNSMNYITYSKLKKFPVQGSFLSYYPELTWAVAILTPFTDFDPGTANITTEYRERANAIRYANKVLGYAKAGLDVCESKKHSGFEDVKKYYQNLTGDPWEFEKRFRHPLEKIFLKQPVSPKFIFNEGVELFLTQLQRNN